jgi:large subunit ribosomal protein L24
MTTNFTLHIKKGDTIKVISGKDKGKIGEVIQILRHSHQVIIKTRLKNQ